MRSASIVRHPLDVARVSTSVSSDANGAVALFLGTVRSTNDGKPVTGIEYSAYDEMAEKEMTTILNEAAEKFGVTDLRIEHRVGELHIGEASIAVAAAHPHRKAALDALRYVVEETKARAPIWKLEHYADGTREWVNAGSQPK
jgi:molybdopterin synthase catalytic subunit